MTIQKLPFFPRRKPQKQRDSLDVLMDDLIAETLAGMQQELQRTLRCFDKKETPLGVEDAAALLQRQLDYAVGQRNRLPLRIVEALGDLSRCRNADCYAMLEQLSALVSRQKLLNQVLSEKENEYSTACALLNNLTERSIDGNLLPGEEQVSREKDRIREEKGGIRT